MTVDLHNGSEIFQSTPPRGGRPAVQDISRILNRFQSTPPRGGRQYHFSNYSIREIISIHAPAWGATWKVAASARGLSHFNPRTDRPKINVDILHPLAVCPISIHAPAWGATLLLLLSLVRLFYFNPRPRVGGDSPAASLVGTLLIFQSTPPRGGRLFEKSGNRDFSNFNPRPRVGGDLVR